MRCPGGRQRSGETRALAMAIERGEWERIALHLFVALAELVRADPAATIDDVIELLNEDGRGDVV